MQIWFDREYDTFWPHDLGHEQTIVSDIRADICDHHSGLNADAPWPG